jgi:hypothetical protein
MSGSTSAIFAKQDKKRDEAKRLFARAVRLSMEADYLVGHCLQDENIENAIGLLAQTDIWKRLVDGALECHDSEEEMLNHAFDLSELVALSLIA